MDTTTTTRREARDDAPRRRRRNKGAIIKLTLGGLALVGIGAAATSAAWTDSAFFSSATTSASVDLKGSATGGANTNYTAADTSATAVDLGAISNLTPDSTITKTVYLWNAGTAPLAPTWGTANPTSLIDPTCVTVTYSTLPASIPGDPTGVLAGSKITATVTVKMLTNAPQATCSNKSASLVVSVQGATVALP